jgi:formate dehydrogenase (NADP+) beta subunit
VFAGGDMVPSDRTVTIGVGHGKKAARTSTPGCAAPPT